MKRFELVISRRISTRIIENNLTNHFYLSQTICKENNNSEQFDLVQSPMACNIKYNRLVLIVSSLYKTIDR